MLQHVFRSCVKRESDCFSIAGILCGGGVVSPVPFVEILSLNSMRSCVCSLSSNGVVVSVILVVEMHSLDSVS